MSVCVTEKEAT